MAFRGTCRAATRRSSDPLSRDSASPLRAPARRIQLVASAPTRDWYQHDQYPHASGSASAVAPTAPPPSESPEAWTVREARAWRGGSFDFRPSQRRNRRWDDLEILRHEFLTHHERA